MKKVLLYGSLALNLAWLLIYFTTPKKISKEYPVKYWEPEGL